MYAGGLFRPLFYPSRSSESVEISRFSLSDTVSLEVSEK